MMKVSIRSNTIDRESNETISDPKFKLRIGFSHLCPLRVGSNGNRIMDVRKQFNTVEIDPTEISNRMFDFLRGG